jgi:hypothetical protein
MIGDIPPPLLRLAGWRWPRGPFCIPLSMSSSPMIGLLNVSRDAF